MKHRVAPLQEVRRHPPQVAETAEITPQRAAAVPTSPADPKAEAAKKPNPLVTEEGGDERKNGEDEDQDDGERRRDASLGALLTG